MLDVFARSLARGLGAQKRGILRGQTTSWTQGAQVVVYLVIVIAVLLY